MRKIYWQKAKIKEYFCCVFGEYACTSLADSGVPPLPSTLALVPLAHFIKKCCTYSLTAQIVHHKCFCITESLRCLTRRNFTAHLQKTAKI